MRAISTAELVSASVVAIATDRKDTVASDSEDWFGEIARSLLGKDAGFGLHLATGAPEGSCYKYVTTNEHNRRHPPANILRLVLRTDGGWQWLSGVMDGSDAPWWLELKRARRIAEAIAAIE